MYKADRFHESSIFLIYFKIELFFFKAFRDLLGLFKGLTNFMLLFRYLWYVGFVSCYFLYFIDVFFVSFGELNVFVIVCTHTFDSAYL